jgi:hypothetical protein
MVCYVNNKRRQLAPGETAPPPPNRPAQDDGLSHETLSVMCAGTLAAYYMQ